jgi:hypothetical protein
MLTIPWVTRVCGVMETGGAKACARAVWVDDKAVLIGGVTGNGVISGRHSGTHAAKVGTPACDLRRRERLAIIRMARLDPMLRAFTTRTSRSESSQ